MPNKTELEFRWLTKSELKANPKNWRLHPENQKQALAQAIDEVGFVVPVLFNKRTGYLIDGHARVDQVADDREIPAIIIDCDPKQEARILASLDNITSLANADYEKLAELIETADFEKDSPIDEMLLNVLDNFKEFEEDQEQIDPDELPDVQISDRPGIHIEFETEKQMHTAYETLSQDLSLKIKSIKMVG